MQLSRGTIHQTPREEAQAGVDIYIVPSHGVYHISHTDKAKQIMDILTGFSESWLSFQVAASVFAVLVVAAVLTIVPYAFASSRPRSFPPGPPTKPFLGNLHLIPASKSFTVYVSSCSCFESVRRPSTNPRPLGSASGRKTTAPSSDSSSGPPTSLFSTTTEMSKSKQL